MTKTQHSLTAAAIGLAVSAAAAVLAVPGASFAQAMLRPVQSHQSGTGNLPMDAYNSAVAPTRRQASATAVSHNRTVIAETDPDAGIRFELRRDWSRGR
jgi:hypothetical protein